MKLYNCKYNNSAKYHCVRHTQICNYRLFCFQLNNLLVNYDKCMISGQWFKRK